MSSSSTREGKKSKGRQKINMQKIENEPYRHVTFSKRRKGCFKKSYEISILTGAEVAAIIFSPGGKIYSYGHPTVDEVIERFYPTIERTSQPLTLIEKMSRQMRDEKIARTNAELAMVQENLTFERERGVKLNKELAESKIQDWEANDPKKKTKEQLQHSILELKNICGLFEREINSRKLLRQQEYEALDVGHNYYGGEGVLSSQLGINNVYDGSSRQGLITPFANAGGQESIASGAGGGVFPFMMGHDGSGVGYSNVVADPAGLGLHSGGGFPNTDMIGSSGVGNIVDVSDDGFSSGGVSMPPNGLMEDFSQFY